MCCTFCYCSQCSIPSIFFVPLLVALTSLCPLDIFSSLHTALLCSTLLCAALLYIHHQLPISSFSDTTQVTCFITLLHPIIPITPTPHHPSHTHSHTHPRTRTRTYTGVLLLSNPALPRHHRPRIQDLREPHLGGPQGGIVRARDSGKYGTVEL